MLDLQHSDGLMHRLRRDPDQPSEALFQFEEPRNSARYSEGAERQDHRGRPVVRREQTKTTEQEDEPEDQQSDERFRSSLPNLLGEKPACITDPCGERRRLPKPPLVAGV